MSNTFTELERREIAGRARTLHERLDGPANVPGDSPPVEPAELLAAWADQFPDESAFRERLERDGLTEAAVREQAAATRWPADEPLPDWIDDLEALTRYAEETGPDGTPPVPVPEETAFPEFLGTFAGYARDRLPDDRLPTDAPNLEAWLVERLEAVSIRPLYVEFKSFVEYHDPKLAAADPSAFDDPPTERYDAFVDAMFDGGIGDLWLEYPVLARHVIRRIDQWQEAVTELCRRIREDRSKLTSRFDVEGSVEAFEPLSTDAHADGRVPVRVSFESGAVVYKPRPVDAGVAFYAVLDRLADRSSVPAPRAPTYLARDEYGWMAPVPYREPPDEAAVERYYERAGATLCVAYAVNLTDCQFENLIVAGADPTVVDGETAFHPHVAPAAMPADTSVAATIHRSVLLTAMLPLSVGDPSEPDELGVAATLAGLGTGSDPVELSSVTEPNVEAANTDVMTVTQTHPSVDQTTNTPSVGGEDHPPGEHVDALVRGFERSHRAIRRLRDDGRFFREVVDPGLVADVDNRLVYRPTVTYASVLRSAVGRDPLRDGARFTVELESLAVPFFDGRIEGDRYWPLYAAERDAIRRLDVPRFGARADGTTVYHDGSPTGVEVDASGFGRCRRRVESMDAADGRREARLLEACFETGVPEATPPPGGASDGHLLVEAADLFDDAVEAAVPTGDGERWVSIGGATLDQALSLIPSNDSLYNGRGGIALAAAALYVATGRDRYRRRATDLLDAAGESASRSSFDPGGLTGTASVAYVLAVAADLLDRPVYGIAATDLAGGIPFDRLGADGLDVVGGTAGTLLGLLACYERHGGSEVRDRAIACGDRLLDARTTVDGGRTWTTDQGESEPGFAHGTSGIAYALARLGAVVGDERYVTAAREAFAVESTCSPSTAGDDLLYPHRWCHGRTGVGLARLAAGRLLDDGTLVDEGRELLSRPVEPAPFDNVCCGNLGRAAALVEAADGDVPAARELADRCLARRSREGSLSLPRHSPAVVNPLFFDGLSGAAYTLLRLRDPGLPCVLLLE